jgi:hypothetical protein
MAGIQRPTMALGKPGGSTHNPNALVIGGQVSVSF